MQFQRRNIFDSSFLTTKSKLINDLKLFSTIIEPCNATTVSSSRVEADAPLKWVQRTYTACPRLQAFSTHFQKPYFQLRLPYQLCLATNAFTNGNFALPVSMDGIGCCKTILGLFGPLNLITQSSFFSLFHSKP